MSSKNRLKNARGININNVQYFWNVSDKNCDGDDGCRLRIWKDRAKIYETVIHTEIITPKSIREIILKVML